MTCVTMWQSVLEMNLKEDGKRYVMGNTGLVAILFQSGLIL